MKWRNSRTCIAQTVVVSLLLFGFGAVALVWSRQSQLRRNAPVLNISAEALDIGDVWATATFERIIPLENKSAMPVKIERFITSCGCLQIVEPARATIPANGRVDIRVAIDLHWTSSGAHGDFSEPFSEEFVPLVSGARTQQSFVVHGVIKRPFLTTSDQIVLKGGATAGPDDGIRSFPVECHHAIQGFDAQLSDPELKRFVTLRSRETRPRTFELTLSASGGAPRGKHKFSVVLLGDGTSQRKIRQEVPVTFDVVPDIYIVPEKIQFGAIVVGATADCWVTIGSHSGRAITMASAEPQPNRGTSVERVEIPESETSIWLVRQIATGSGPHRGSLTFDINSGVGSEREKVEVPVSYFGIDNAEHVAASRQR